ncbi:HAMP domain-containing sensor histidine kinase [Sphingobium sp. WCS2017Hpa-17]|uniref:sensor histidine kinase n=1 Tax=Sphingobium sp. WCS2017Hpa-17 TaxID=3073638 RepID=UPI002889BA19|nr:HAMP domain-containing sensor histidine kinase [Sphingobium sp. WCS2017Hpa-17]
MRALISFRGLFLTSATAMALALVTLLGTIVYLQGSTQQFAQRADMAQRQALLLARIDAESAQALFNPSAPSRRALADAVTAYFASIDAETAMLGGEASTRDYQAREAADARRLARMLQSSPAALPDIRALVRHIAARENDEAEDATARARQAQSDAWRLILVIIMALLALPLGIAFILWRHLVRPLEAVAQATKRVADEHDRQPLPASGLLEMRQLIDHFDDMAQAVEQKVRLRTAELEALNRRLAQTDQRRRLFLSKVSHELRTPVTVMRGEAEVALRLDDDAPTLRDALHRILDNNLFLERRLNDLLTLARAEDGVLPLRSDPVDLAQLAQQVARNAVGFATASGVRLELASLDQPMPVIGDPDRLQQALLALIDNGVKFSPPGGTIRLSGTRRHGEMGIVVTDEGPGIADSELERIFDPYVQGKAGRSLGGTGLGLSLARWIAQAHAGGISACNRQEGEGLCVSLRLPARV